jgi:hypothetical protein
MGRRRHDRRLFRGGERSRLASMCLLLLMLFVLIPLIRQRSDWFEFFVASPPPASPDDEPKAAKTQAEKSEGQDKKTEDKKTEDKPQVEKTKQASDEPVKSPPSKSPPKSLAEMPAPPPLEGDELQRARIKELLSVVTDGGEKMAVREMPAYFHLLKLARETSPEVLKEQARVNPKFNDFYQYADKHRGEVVQVELNVRRVDRILIDEENVAEVKEVYELWGWTEEAKAWLYVGIVPELPQGMKVGTLEERVTLVGYFFKLQGYQPGDAKINARPLRAPAIIGRVIWKPPAPPAATEPWWMWLVLGGLSALIVGFLAIRILGSRRGRRFSDKTASKLPASAPDWLRAAPSEDGPRESGQPPA